MLKPINRRDRMLAAVFLASGAALLVYILSGISLAWTFLGLGGLAMLVFAIAVYRMPATRRTLLLRRVAVGAIAGLVGTLVYDVSRLAMVEFLGMQLQPFEAWRLFGMALLRTEETTAAVMVAGTAFHFLNGIAFGIAFTVAFGRKGILAGIVWALILETFMISVYPGWLGLKALEEFMSVSITSHVLYGWVLGGLAKYLLTSSPWREPTPPRREPTSPRTEHDHTPTSTAGAGAADPGR